MELQEPFMLSALLWTEAPTGEHQYERIALLQFRKRPVRAPVIRKRAIGKNGARHNVRSHRNLSFGTTACVVI
jgi:hypothetical protein